MKRIEVELLTDQGNNAVLRLPQRRFPGVLLQGDTLRNLLVTAEHALALSGEVGSELREEIEGLVATLRDIYDGYELATSE